jgi:hypothetical protein
MENFLDFFAVGNQHCLKRCVIRLFGNVALKMRAAEGLLPYPHLHDIMTLKTRIQIFIAVNVSSLGETDNSCLRILVLYQKDGFVGTLRSYVLMTMLATFLVVNDVRTLPPSLVIVT